MNPTPMKSAAALLASTALLALAACGPGAEPAKPAAEKPAAQAPAPSAAPADKKEAEKKEDTHAPDTHGMPGMSELFKDDKKK
jgi:flagellar basal body L-ring protein FlgH